MLNLVIGHWRLPDYIMPLTIWLRLYLSIKVLLHGRIRELSIGSEFVKKDLLSKDDGRLISRLFNMRQSGDYDDLFDWTEEEVFPFFEKTRTFLSRMEDLISLK